MLGKAHMLIGAAAGCAVLGLYPDAPGAVWTIPVALIAGGLPDVLDSENAAGRQPLGLSWSGIKRDSVKCIRKAQRAGFVGWLPTLLLGHLLLLPRMLGAMLLDVIARAVPHRELTHWGIAWAGLSLGALALARLLGASSQAIPMAFSAGYASHILADMMTVSGIPLFGPLWDEKLHLLPKMLRFTYKNPVQWLVVLVVWGLTLWWVGPRVTDIVSALGG